ncbi:bacterial peptide chain release factor 2 (bRF-2) [Natronincola ferrireducens]|uniref:Peptide chain release factor 2 n=2 Tax=Natronincola ferrireducens TaxID=393762 RepID=A0A1G8XRG6_9FIRM|nr:bacterial peptide chain release factor 2 (bRF-2) [Natronincola ferrireducens]
MGVEGFWNDPSAAQEILKKSKELKNKIEIFEGLIAAHEELETMILFIEEGDSSFEKEMLESMKRLQETIDAMKIETLLKGEYDKNNCIVSIHAGTGGLDAQDWAKMLWRMYTRWAEEKNYRVKLLDLLQDPEAGIKSVTLLIEGLNAYGYLKAEKGVHRLVRISPFDSSGKRHTSFASVDVMPEMDDTVEVDIKATDLKIDTYRASGAGGQHVNKTDSAVRITHLPTGIVVQCQNERSQHTNRDTAMKMLKAKLLELKELEQKEKIEDIQGEYSQIAWGSQIRSYVFNPYNLVKDHRTNIEVGNIQAVMDGDIDLFINGFLQKSLEG